MALASLSQIVTNIDTEQRQKMHKRAAAGHIRSLELLWSEKVKEHCGPDLIVPPWTGRQRENCRDLLARYGRNIVQSLMLHAIIYWQDIAKVQRTTLTPLPTFNDFYYLRDMFYARMVHTNRLEQQKVELDTPPTLSLVELVKKERAKRLQEDKANG